ncbi:MAG: glycosyltransferase family 2 protein [Acidobacteria bacterium]|jgi:succinoglycan biosynthesis protein ExoA|nr:glycosyltransferase family 2 protein [Acidobacteriota bacterium]
MTAPLVSIVIACRNEARYIESCVRGFLNGTVREIEVLVVDGDSDDGSAALVERLAAEENGRVRLLRNPARRTPMAFNLGVRAARGRYIAIFGAHSVPAPNWVQANLDALAAHPEAAAAGGLLNTISHTFVGKAIAAALSSPFGVGNVRFRVGGPPGPADTVVFGCYRREVFAKYGLFDESFLTNQDDEFNLRLVAQGETLYFDPAIQLDYNARPTWGKALNQYWRYGRYKLNVFRKNGRIGSWRQLAPAAWTAFLLLAVVGAALFPALRLPALLGVTAYLVAGLVAMAAKVPQYGAACVLFLPVAASIHLAYGIGTWQGLFETGYTQRH